MQLTVPAWMVRLEAGFGDVGRTPPGTDALEPMVELLRRTDGVRAVMVAPRMGGLAVAMCLSVPDAATAVARARALASASARYAGLGPLTIDRVEVTEEPA
jgi:hypothetical protein